MRYVKLTFLVSIHGSREEKGGRGGPHQTQIS